MIAGAARRRGAVLILVLLLLTLTVTLVLGLAREVKVEVAVAGQAVDEAELRALAQSAVERALAEVCADRYAPATLLSPWRDDEARFRGAPHGAGRFWLLLSEPDPGDARELRFGVRDEAGKLNVNAATREQLLQVPGITEDAVDGILDWRDEDEEALEFGAEAPYYAALDPPYLPKNGPIEALEELLRVKGVDAAILWGEDRNRNGILDPGEDDGDESFPPDDMDGLLDRGLSDYLTVYSRELNRTLDGRARLVWSQATVEDLTARLTEAGLAEGPLNRLRQLKVTGQEVQGLGQLIAGPEFDEAAATIVLDELSVLEAESNVGRINVNTAPREVLLGLPGLEAGDVESILARRLEGGADLTSPAWLLRAIPPPKLQAIADLVTTRAEQFTVHAAVCLDHRPARFMRVEVVIDRGFVPARIVTWKDLTGLGFPLPGERGTELP